MESEDFFLTFACLLLFFDLIQLSKVKPRERKKLEYGFYASTLACGLIVASYLILMQAFLKDDFSLREVYSHSSSSLPTLYKVYAAWAGMGGSMLFLTFLTAIVYFAYRFTTYEKRRVFRITVYKILDFILVFFLLITLMNSPFERLSGTPMDGAGLNPLLQTFWMFIHPPIVFLGYVFVILAFAFILAGMSTKGRWDRGMFRLSLQVAWLFLALGIAIGGLWAYEVLGWGGYWAWDPVETASLLPWLTLTAYFHLRPIEKRSKSLTGEFTILITFSTTILTTALTRGGLLVSVHAFGASPVGPALLFLILCMVSYFFYLKRRTQRSLFAFEIKTSSLLSTSFSVGYWSLIILTLICFWGIAFPLIASTFLGASVSISAEFFNNWCYPFTLVFVAALIGCNTSDTINFRKYGILIVGALCTGLILAFVGQPTPNFMANLGFPLLILALFVIGYKLAQLLLKTRRSVQLLGSKLIHLGVIVVLIGVFVSSTAVQASGDVLAKPNSAIETLGLKIELQNFTVYEGTGNVHLGDRCYSEYSAVKMDVIINDGTNRYHEALWIYLYTSSGIVCKPLIIRTWTRDLYIHMHHTQSIYHSLMVALTGQALPPDDLVINVRIIPSVNLVWIGTMLLSSGMVLPLIKGITRLTAQKKQ